MVCANGLPAAPRSEDASYTATTPASSPTPRNTCSSRPGCGEDLVRGRGRGRVRVRVKVGVRVRVRVRVRLGLGSATMSLPPMRKADMNSM